MSRQKQVEITDDIVAQIERVTNTTIDPDNIVVFEAAALSTKPLHKPGSIYHGARPSRSVLEDMAAALNDGSESVPLHTLHMQSIEIPVGRVFSASLFDEIDGSTTLRAMFYLPLAEKELIEKINLSILDEVSVGVKSEQALCSKCGFDYFGEEADFSHLWSQTCENGHTIGEDGTHLKLVGLDRWMELSLVSRGASENPKILSRTKQLVSKDEYDRMAADGTPLEALVLFTSTAMETPSMPGENNSTESETGEAEATIEALTAQVASLAAQVASLAEKVGADDEPEDEPTVDELKAALAEAQAKIAELENPAAGEDDLKAELDAAKAKLAELEKPDGEEIELPPGGVAASAVSDAKTQPGPVVPASAFKTKRNRR